MTAEGKIQAAVERHKALLAELGVLEKFISDHPRLVGNPFFPRWTEEEVATLEALWSHGVSAKQIAGRLHRTASAVASMAHAKGFKRRLVPETKPGSTWTDDEIDQLELHYQTGSSLKKIAAGFGRSIFSVKHKASKLGLRRSAKMGRPKGAKTEKARPQAPTQLAPGRPPGKLVPAPVPASTVDKIHERARRAIGLPEKRRQPAEPSVMNSWAEAEDKALRRMWKRPWSNYVIAKRIGKSAPQVVRRARELKLGPRPRPDGKRKCVKCQEPFVPKDWTTDWYCDKHRQQAKQSSSDLITDALGDGVTRHHARFVNV